MIFITIDIGDVLYFQDVWLVLGLKYLRYINIVYGLQISSHFRFLNKEIKCLNRIQTNSAG